MAQRLLDVTGSAQRPKSKKRVLEILSANASTPYAATESGQKRCFLDVTSSVTSSPAVTSCTPHSSGFFYTSMVRISRGVQTIVPQTANRQCQVSVIRKIRSTAATQTTPAREDEEDPVRDEVGCQTDDPAPCQETGCGPSQPLVSSSMDGVACQTEHSALSEMAFTLADSLQTRRASVNDEDVTQPSLSDPVTVFLDGIAQEYGIKTSTVRKKKKKRNKEKNHALSEEMVEAMQERIVSKVSKELTQNLNRTLSRLFARHLSAYRRKLVIHRKRQIRWMEQQRRHRASAGLRKVIVWRKPLRPEVDEKAVQCEPDANGPRVVNVGTQWIRQKPQQTGAKRKATKVPPATDSKKPPAKVVASKNSKAKVAAKAAPSSATSIQSTTIPTGSRNCPPASSGAGVVDDGCDEATSRRQPMRQTKLSGYVERRNSNDATVDRRPRRKQQGECASERSKSVEPEDREPPAPNTKAKTQQRKKERHRQSPELCIDETPSELCEPCERKHYPYRKPDCHYPSQCSKSTETSFLTPSRLREPPPHYCDRSVGGIPNYSMLLSPLEQLYIDRQYSGRPLSNRDHFDHFFHPLDADSVPPTPTPTPPRRPPSMVYVNRPEPRVLVRNKHNRSTSVLARDKSPPTVRFISSQQLYSQIGRAVENALNNKTLNALATMYGEPIIETFNAMESESNEAPPVPAASGGTVASNDACNYRSLEPEPFICSSAKDNHQQPPAPFHPERSPSLSPIVYEEESGEENL
ncbi:uncharacterized protein LOC128267052 [Anopheles cruzii]|uniref:uncharacterized protein LOC128267052 n=1 Tax=Anopheles cruzii TaxID=68878 RepID=UPI0022EC459B|nr:uncharacterized protein LOC128267052 [Anopheles cruzii]